MGKGSISSRPGRQMRLIAAGHVLWFAVVCLLGAWWGRLLSRQASRIAELERLIGLSNATVQEHYERTQHMVFWESLVFFGLLFLATVILFFTYLRELKRTRSLQAFFASVTHELRTPLTSIRLQAESIADALPAGASERPLVERLLEDTNRLESQVERTLELARVEGGGSVLSQPFVVKAWIEYFLRNWGDSAGTRLNIKTELGDHAIEADSAALGVILRNLLDNSLKHSGRAAEGAVNVRLRSEEQGDWVVLRYADNGHGFSGDPRNLGRLFQKGEKSQGAGVGLYLVSMLMQRMGGRAEFVAGSNLETVLWFRKAGADHV